jgi:hypothetical protein
LLQITAPISDGSSGGPIVNSRGQVVGIAVGSLTDGQNLNFATPASLITSLVSPYSVFWELLEPSADDTWMWLTNPPATTASVAKPSQPVLADKLPPKEILPPSWRKGSPEAVDPISGEWNATADAQGTTIPFTLKMRLEGDKVTGETSSARGTAPISKGNWTAEKLSLALDTPNGWIRFTGVLKDAKLVGDFDYAGQLQGKWEATKK